MAHAKYGAFTKSDIEFCKRTARIIADEERFVAVSRPVFQKIFPMSMQDDPRIGFGNMMLDLAHALEQVELAYKTVTGKDYSYEGALEQSNLRDIRLNRETRNESRHFRDTFRDRCVEIKKKFYKKRA